MAYEGKIVFETDVDTSGFERGIDAMRGIVDGANVFKSLIDGISSVGSAFNGTSTASKGFLGVLGSISDFIPVIGDAIQILLPIGEMIFNHVMKPTREAQESLGQMAEGIVNASNTMLATAPNLTAFAGAFALIDGAQQDAHTSLTAAQTGMTEILRTEVEERDGLMQTDIENYLTYYQQMTGANQILLDTEQTKLQLINELRAQDLAGQELNNEQYIAFANQHIADATAQGDTILSLIESQRLAEMAANEAWYQSLTPHDQQWYAGKYESRKASIQEGFAAETAEVQAGLASVYETYSVGYSERMMQDTDFMTQISNAQARLLEAEELYHMIIDNLWNDPLGNNGEAGYIQWDAEKTYANDRIAIWNELSNALSDEQEKQIKSMMNLALQTEMHGGTLTEAQRTMVDNLIGIWGEIPENARGDMPDVIQGMLNGLREEEPGLYDAMAAAGDNTLAALREALGVHSPSWKTAEIFGYVMEGAMQGLDDNREALIENVAGISDDILNALSTHTTEEGEVSSLGSAIADNIVEGIETSLAEADLSGMAETLQTAVEINAEAFTEVGKLAGTYVLDGFNESISGGVKLAA